MFLSLLPLLQENNDECKMLYVVEVSLIFSLSLSALALHTFIILKLPTKNSYFWQPHFFF